MKKTLLSVILSCVFMLGFIGVVQAATLEDAKALGIKAAAHVKQIGKDAAIKEFKKAGNPFDKGNELYVTLHDTSGRILAHPKTPELSGQNDIQLKDSTGKLFVQEHVKIAEKGGGWTTYTWINPATKKEQFKKVWVQPVEGTDLYTMCGLFQ